MLDQSKYKVFTFRANLVNIHTILLMCTPEIVCLIKHHKLVELISCHRINKWHLLKNHVEQNNPSVEDIDLLAEITFCNSALSKSISMISGANCPVVPSFVFRTPFTGF